MKTIAEALGLQEGASEAECLSALSALRSGVVPRADHEQVAAQLAAASNELAELRASTRQAKVDGVIEAALAAKKILPAEREDYLALCSSDEGLATVEKLLGSKPALLSGSGLGSKGQPDAGKIDASDPVKLGAAASAYMVEQAGKGVIISAADAVAHLIGDLA